MKLSSLVDRRLVIPSLRSTTRREAIAEIMECVGRHVEGIDKDAVLSALYLREEVSSTAIDEGVAVPHARVEGLDSLIFAIGVSHAGIADFGARDGKPVRLLFLIAAPSVKNSLLIHTMAGVARLCVDEARRGALATCKDAGCIVDVIEKSGVIVKKELTCGDLMDTDIVGIDPDMSLKEVAALFVKTKTDGLPVIEKDGKLLGEITGKELITVGLPGFINMFSDLSFLPSMEPFEEFFKREGTMKVREVYNPHVFTISETSSIVEAAFLMVTKNRRRIYVVREGKLVGTVYRKDFISKVLHV